LRWPEGIAKDVLVKIQDYYAPADFLILDIPGDEDTPIILGDLSSTPLTQPSTLDLDKSISDLQRYDVNLIVILSKNSQRNPDQGGGTDSITIHPGMDGLDFQELRDPMT
jgi:hypothetical protein